MKVTERLLDMLYSVNIICQQIAKEKLQLKLKERRQLAEEKYQKKINSHFKNFLKNKQLIVRI